MTTRVFVHIGTPKSGTTFLQGAMWGHRAQLRQRGVLIPGGNMSAVFRAAIELRGAHEFWGYDPERIAGTWNRLCAAAREFDGTTVISHELLGASTKDQADRAWQALEGLETHVVVTARDLARQITSEWQERIKNRNTFSFAEFTGGLLDAAESGSFDRGFWMTQHLPSILQRWAGSIPPDRVHVVVPPNGGPRNALWEMFGQVVGFDATDLDPLASGPRPNETLGRAEVALLRQINALIPKDFPPTDYRRVVKRALAQRVLAGQTSDRLTCPADVVARVIPIAEDSVAQLRSSGFQFHGDPQDLIPTAQAAADADPDEVDQATLLATAEASIVGLLGELAAVTGPNKSTRSPAKPVPEAPVTPPSKTAESQAPIEVPSEVLDPVALEPTPTVPAERRTAVPVSMRHRPKRVFLHIGSPKTGTTFLQNVLWNQKELAAEHGLLLPGERFNDHYLATLDLRGLAAQPPHPQRAVGMWHRLVKETSKWSGDSLISHELFAGANAAQAAAAVKQVKDTKAEVHIVITVRDLVRQLTAEWQEHVKHRSSVSFNDFVRSVWDDDARLTWFWQVQDFAGVLERWGAAVPAENIHVVTVPGRGAPPTLLWERFAGVLGLDPEAFNTDLPRSNSSLGAEQAELLRRVNSELGERLPLPGPYPLVVKNVLAHRILEPRSGAKLTLGAEDTAMAIAESKRIAERLDKMGVDVVGDLDELVPQIDPATVHEVSAPAADEVLDEGVAAVASLLVALNQRRAVVAEAQDMMATARSRPLRWALVQHSATSRPLRGMRKVYRRLRRRPTN